MVHKWCLFLKFVVICTASTALSTSAVSSIDKSKYRLPTAVLPILYDLYLYPDLETGLFQGTVIILINVTDSTTSIVLHTNKLNIISVTVKGEDTDYEINETYETLTISRKNGKPFTSTFDNISIKFGGDMKDRLVGLYTSSYTNLGNTTTIATSKFEPTYARQAFPCFDEPNMKAKYIVHLLKPNKDNYIALSNYPVAKIENYDDSNDLVTFEETVSMSTYLTCFIVSDFTYTETTFNNSGTPTPLRVYASPGNLDKTTYAREVAKKVIEYYVNYFGLPYPLPKLDMVAIPDFVSGAMEHWGLVTYRETALLYTNITHSTFNKQRVATVIAHELAHSWFGNLVTMDWWNDLWLNEGFASYIEYKGTDAAEPDWDMMSQFQRSDLHTVLSSDAAVSSHPIVENVTTPDEITSIFDAISYGKGASILRMLEDTVGELNFQKGVTNYLKKYAYGNAVTKYFLDEIQTVIGEEFNVSQMMDTYTIQMGYPVVNVTYDEVTRNYTLTQKRFLRDPDATFSLDTNYGYKWTIPITYISNLGKSKTRILFPYDQENITVQKPAEASWLKFNYNQIGYYRVNYETSIWNNLIDIYSTLPVMDRTHLLEESFSIAEAGLLAYKIPLDLSKQLTNEIHYTPWSVVSSKLQDIQKYLIESDKSNAFKTYVRTIVSNAYNNLTWTERESDSHLTKLTRVVVLSLACAMDDIRCLNEAKLKFNFWINNTVKPLSQDLRGLVYKYGMVNADETTWNKLLEVYNGETDANEKLKLINGLANVKNVTLLQRLLELSKDASLVRSQDYFIVLGYICGNTLGFDLVWNFMRNEWEYLVTRFSLNNRYLGKFIRTVTATFASQQRINEMNIFFKKYPNAGAGTGSRRSALETVNNNIRWLNRYKSTVESWIQTLH